jgi:hypothetical protein
MSLGETMMLSGDSMRIEGWCFDINVASDTQVTVPLCLPCFVSGSCLSAQQSGFPIREFMLVPSVD